MPNVLNQMFCTRTFLCGTTCNTPWILSMKQHHGLRKCAILQLYSSTAVQVFPSFPAINIMLYGGCWSQFPDKFCIILAMSQTLCPWFTPSQTRTLHGIVTLASICTTKSKFQTIGLIIRLISHGLVVVFNFLELF